MSRILQVARNKRWPKALLGVILLVLCAINVMGGFMSPLSFLQTQVAFMDGAISLPTRLSSSKETTMMIAEEENLESIRSTESVADTASKPIVPNSPPNLLFILADEMRFDQLHFLQAQMQNYEGKTLIRTPNLDRLAANGVTFTQTYCASPLCTPSRGCLWTGNTLQRTGLLNNYHIQRPYFYTKMGIMKERIDKMQGFEQVLSDNLGYTAEYYGKLHLPPRMLYSKKNDTKKAIRYNFFSYRNQSFYFDDAINTNFNGAPRHEDVVFLLQQDGVSLKAEPGQMGGGVPYVPIQLDSRYGLDPNTPFQRTGSWDRSGIYPPENNRTATSVLGDTVLRALDRLAKERDEDGTPFALTVSFMNPHMPYFSTHEFAEHYWEHRANISIPKNIGDRMEAAGKHPYRSYLMRSAINRRGWDKYKFKDPDKIAELTAVYYGMIEEIDFWIGAILTKLEATGNTNNTMVIFTSDHGEMLGAHALLGKEVFYEESVRVPMIMSFPGRLPRATQIHDIVSHIDIVPTIYDYLGSPGLLSTDGTSLRRIVERKSYNEDYDEGTVVSELDKRYIEKANKLSPPLVSEKPNFLVRNGPFKLMIPKEVDTDMMDLMFNLDDDPHELANILDDTVSDEMIGKAEHLKALLVEWMGRMDSEERYYSDNKWNLGVGQGDRAEIAARRTWRKLDYWQSDRSLTFREPAFLNGSYVRNEFVYVGRSTEGTLILSTHLEGRHGQYFTVDPAEATVSSGDCVKIKLSFRSVEKVPMESLEAFLKIQNSVNGASVVPIRGAASASVQVIR